MATILPEGSVEAQRGGFLNHVEKKYPQAYDLLASLKKKLAKKTIGDEVIPRPWLSGHLKIGGNLFKLKKDKIVHFSGSIEDDKEIVDGKEKWVERLRIKIIDPDTQHWQGIDIYKDGKFRPLIDPKRISKDSETIQAIGKYVEGLQKKAKKIGFAHIGETIIRKR